MRAYRAEPVLSGIPRVATGMPFHRLTRRQALKLGAAAAALGALRPAPDAVAARAPQAFALDLDGGGARVAAGGWRTTRIYDAPRRFDLVGLELGAGRGRRRAAPRAAARRRVDALDAPARRGRPRPGRGARACPGPTRCGRAAPTRSSSACAARRAGCRRASCARSRPRGRRAPAPSWPARRGARSPAPRRSSRASSGAATASRRAAAPPTARSSSRSSTTPSTRTTTRRRTRRRSSSRSRSSTATRTAGTTSATTSSSTSTARSSRAGPAASTRRSWARRPRASTACRPAWRRSARSPTSRCRRPRWTRVAQLIGWKLSLHGVPTAGLVTVTSAGGPTNRFPAGTPVTFERISGHRDGNATSCPGDQLYAQLPDLRARAAGLRRPRRRRHPARRLDPAARQPHRGAVRLAALRRRLSSPLNARVDILYATGGGQLLPDRLRAGRRPTGASPPASTSPTRAASARASPATRPAPRWSPARSRSRSSPSSR